MRLVPAPAARRCVAWRVGGGRKRYLPRCACVGKRGLLSAASLEPLQRSAEVGDQVLRTLQAHRDAKQVFGRGRGRRLDGGTVFDERLSAT